MCLNETFCRKTKDFIWDFERHSCVPLVAAEPSGAERPQKEQFNRVDSLFLCGLMLFCRIEAPCDCTEAPYGKIEAPFSRREPLFFCREPLYFRREPLFFRRKAPFFREEPPFSGVRGVRGVTHFSCCKVIIGWVVDNGITNIPLRHLLVRFLDRFR